MSLISLNCARNVKVLKDSELVFKGKPGDILCNDIAKPETCKRIDFDYVIISQGTLKDLTE